MTRLKTASGQFGLIGGICRATSDCILVQEPAPTSPVARWKGQLYILAEPVMEGGRGYQVAREAIVEIAQVYYDCTSPSVTACLGRAIQAANRSLLQHNIQVSGHEKITVGVTCAVVHGEELFLAQVLPGQAYAVHQGHIQAFPLSPSWDPEATTMPTMARLLALGWSEDITPEFFSSPLSPGDVFCLCTSNVGRFLGHEEAEQVLLYQEPSDVIEQLYRRVHQQSFNEAHAIVVEVRPAGGRYTSALFTRAGLKERARMAGETVAAWGGFLVGEVRRLVQRPKQARSQAVKVRRPRPKPAPTPPSEMTPPLVRPKPTGPWWKTLQEKVYNLFHPRAGFPRLERPRLRITPPPKPRRIAPYLLVAAALAVLGLLIYLIIHNNQQRQESAVNRAVEQAQQLIVQAGQTGDLTEANRILDDAEQQLQEALTPASPHPRIELTLRDLHDERDRLNSVTRFENLEQMVNLDALSKTMASSGFTGGCLGQCAIRDLATISDTIYLLEESMGTVYQYSASPNGVIPLLWGGMEVADADRGIRHVASPILDIVALQRPRDTTSEVMVTWLAAVDADHWLYLYRQGQWNMFELTSQASWQNRGIVLGNYQGNLYVLKGEMGQIMKYYRNSYEMGPEVWLTDLRQARIEESLSMAIDGSIYLLLKTGSIQVLSKGRLDRTINYQLYPANTMPGQVILDLGYYESPYLYVVDRYGRIIHLRKEGQPAFIRQLRGPKDTDLQDLRAAVVREQQGLDKRDVFYIAAGSSLYRGSLPSLTLEPTSTVYPTPTP